MGVSLEKKYKTRTGNDAWIYAVNVGPSSQRVHGAVFNKGEWISCEWNSNGRVYNDRTHVSDIAEIPQIIAEDIFASAIFQFGEESQINMAIEEAGELITALAKRDRKHNGSSIVDIVSELVDVSIMMKQMKMIFDDGQMFARIYQEKLTGLASRLKKE